eukprot:COSAG02_NODE_18254_length_950_cov_32.190364_1_plen_63_part_01
MALRVNCTCNCFVYIYAQNSYFISVSQYTFICNLRHLIARFDVANSGGLDREQFRMAMADLGV